MNNNQLIQNTIIFVKDELAGNDASHDWFHIERVWNLAKSIAKQEGFDNTEVIELGALLHDVKDWKYSGSETAGAEAAKEFLQSQNYNPEGIEKVVSIIQGISFKNELGAKGKLDMFPELAIVQDADRLDAIGAIGIGRTFAYAGHKRRPMHDPSAPKPTEITKEQYMNKNPNHDTTINHFYEKLLKLKDIMKTETGKKMAQHRHQFMESFLAEFYMEWDGKL